MLVAFSVAPATTGPDGAVHDAVAAAEHQVVVRVGAGDGVAGRHARRPHRRHLLTVDDRKRRVRVGGRVRRPMLRLGAEPLRVRQRPLEVRVVAAAGAEVQLVVLLSRSIVGVGKSSHLWC